MTNSISAVSATMRVEAVGARRRGIGRDALLQALGLADIEHVARRIQHAIDAGRVGQGLQIGRDAVGACQGRGKRSFGRRFLIHGNGL